MRIKPDAAQLARFRDAVVGSARGATPAQAQSIRTLLARVEAHYCGKAILNAMSAHYEVLGRKPEILMVKDGAIAAPRPSLDHPVRGDTWHVDLEALTSGSTESAVRELAAVYNNMTGVMQDEDPFRAMVARGEPALDPRLESAWAQWLQTESHPGGEGEAAASPNPHAATLRAQTVDHLRSWFRELSCYGGLDRVTLKAVLRRELGRWCTRVDLSYRGLSSIPPLPQDVEVLNVAYNPIRDWRNVPPHLFFLDAANTGMSALPDNLPQELENLNLANNRLGNATLNLPPRLMWLNLSGNGLSAVPALPVTLEELLLQRNRLRELPARWPPDLEFLDVSDNSLTHLPAEWPTRLEVLRADHNRLQQLPVLPDGLEELYVSSNRLTALPHLPDTLRILSAADNALRELPAGLPEEMESMMLSRNRLRRLPERLPAELWSLDLQDNLIEALPASILAMEYCTVYLGGNPIPLQAIPAVEPGRRGPNILLNLPDHSVAAAVRSWWSEPRTQVQARWDAIEAGLGGDGKGLEFAVLLNRLRVSASYQDPAFRAQVEEWLVELSKPERRTLLDETLAVCQGGTETCEDRVVATWNGTQSLRINDDIRRGVYDERVDDVMNIARQMFRMDVLTDIAQRRERSEFVRDPVELYLAYVVRLRHTLGLTAVAPNMRFEQLAGLSVQDLDEARAAVQARERTGFYGFLVLDYEPWQTLLRRKDPQAYAAAEQEAHRLLETTFEQRLREALESKQLDPQDEDARRELGGVVMRDIRYQAMAPLTRARLHAAGLATEAQAMPDTPG